MGIGRRSWWEYALFPLTVPLAAVRLTLTVGVLLLDGAAGALDNCIRSETSTRWAKSFISALTYVALCVGFGFVVSHHDASSHEAAGSPERWRRYDPIINK